MPECEVCGKVVSEKRKIRLGGSELEVCSDCVSLGEEITKKEVKVYMHVSSPDFVPDIEEREVVSDLSEKVRKARETLGMSQKDAAQRIGIQESVFRRIESHGFRPDDQTLRRIEKGLNIHLLKKTEDDVMDILDK
ncbi:MAG: TIGR00270 family protein [Candidatus Aenigmarchaeota archaeon]|nr:TIGR00270 family protein [Candidatus Aenigmarchaeota archaeon]